MMFIANMRERFGRALWGEWCEERFDSIQFNIYFLQKKHVKRLKVYTIQLVKEEAKCLK